MNYAHLLSLVNHVPLASLDTLSREVWQGIGDGSLTEAQAQELAEAIQSRRVSPPRQATGTLENIISGHPPRTLPGAPSVTTPRSWSYFPAKRPQRSPDRARSLERRRTLAASAPMPPTLACKFTTGELAVLKVVADEIATGRLCTLSIPEIAARAGVGLTKARLALRIASSLGLVVITERRVPYRPNLPNMVRIVSREWLAWIARWKPRKAPEHPQSPREQGSKDLQSSNNSLRRGGEGSHSRGPRNQAFTR